MNRNNTKTEEAENAKRQQQLKNWKTKSLIEAHNQPTRMTWLYNTLTRYGNVHEFSPAAKEWVKSKVATEDIASRQEDPLVIDPWWEDEMTPQEKQRFYKLTLPSHQAANLPQAPRRTIGGEPASPGGFGSGLSSPTPDANSTTYRPTLHEVLTNPIGISELSDALDVEGWSAHFDFLLAVAQFKQSLMGIAPEMDCTDEHVTRAGEVVTNFLTKNGVGTIVSDLNSAAVNIAVATATQRIKPKVGQAVVMFDACIVDLERMLTGSFEEFKQSDLYLELCAVLDPSNVKNQQLLSALTDKNNGSGAVNSAAQAVSEVGLPNFSALYNRAPVWYNSNSYQSIKITLHCVRGSVVQRCGQQLYACFGSGSHVLKFESTKGANAGDFNLTVSLPITNTTQFVWIMLGSGGKCQGMIPLSLFELNSKPQDGPFGLRTRTETQPGNLENTLYEKIPVTPGSSLTGSPTSLSGYDEMVVSYQLSQETANDALSGQEFKFIYPDDTYSGGFGDFIRGKVSKKKKRFAEDNFNLDLTYITPTIIAMGFPSEGAEGVYRNPLKQVQQFFLTRHPHAYKIYNLCSERAYDVQKFEGRCEHYPFDDHNPPPFSMIKQFCESVRQFLAESPQNVVSIHCKAGKGRTGTMIAAYLIYAAALTAEQALYQFGSVRTSNGAGVTIGSQIAFVHYFDHFCALRRLGRPGPGRTTLFLESIALRNIGSKYNNQDITWSINMPNREYNEETRQIVEHTKPQTLYPPQYQKPVKSSDGNGLVWNLDQKLFQLNEDVRFEFIAKTGMGGKEKLFHSWINTRFIKLNLDTGIPIARIYKPNLDKASKDVKHKKFDPEFHLELVFTPVETAARKRIDYLSIQSRPELTSQQYMVTTSGSIVQVVPSGFSGIAE